MVILRCCSFQLSFLPSQFNLISLRFCLLRWPVVECTKNTINSLIRHIVCTDQLILNWLTCLLCGIIQMKWDNSIFVFSSLRFTASQRMCKRFRQWLSAVNCFFFSCDRRQSYSKQWRPCLIIIYYMLLIWNGFWIDALDMLWHRFHVYTKICIRLIWLFSRLKYLFLHQTQRNKHFSNKNGETVLWYEHVCVCMCCNIINYIETNESMVVFGYEVRLFRLPAHKPTERNATKPKTWKYNFHRMWA